MSNSIRYNNLDDLEQPSENVPYIYNDEGWNYLECFSGYGKISGELRSSWMHASLIHLIILNPDISEEEVSQIVEMANKNKLSPMFIVLPKFKTTD